MDDSPQDPAVGEGSDQGPSDRSLLRRFRLGSDGAGQLLYYRYAHRLGALVRSRRSSDLVSLVDEEDIVQSAFGSFFRGVNGGSFDVPAGRELWHLLLVITLNKIRAKGAFHRADKRDIRRTVGGDGIEHQPDGINSVDDAYVLLKLTVEESLDRLPDDYRRVVHLRMQGHEVAEIAEKVVRSKRSVERILQECREKLSQTLGDQ